MPQHEASAISFEELWQKVVAEPVRHIETGEDEEALLTVDNLVAWLARIADGCLADGLVGEEEHAELIAANETYARILGAVPPDKLAEKLQTLGELED
jgi:hypothetical protein